MYFDIDIFIVQQDKTVEEIVEMAESLNKNVPGKKNIEIYRSTRKSLHISRSLHQFCGLRIED